MNWNVSFLPDAEKDLEKLDGSQRILILKAIKKIQQNPLSQIDGNNLSGFLKVKLKAAGLRIVYKTIKINDMMLIIVIGARADDEVYDIAQKRIIEYDL